MTAALAIRDDQEFWDDKQLAVLYSTGIDPDVTKPELAAYLHECQRRRLDPFAKQIYLLGRWNRQAGRKVYRSQTSIDGFRVIARRAADKAGIDYGYEATLWFDDKGTRHEVWLSDKPPAAAKVVVIRNGQRFDAIARYAEYVQVNDKHEPVGMWKSMPAGQTAKCAEALALRKAFPEDLGGLYTDDEMAQADNPQRVTAEVVHAEPAANGDAPGAAQPSASPALERVRSNGQWIQEALERSGQLPDKAAALAMWSEIADRLAKGDLTKKEADDIAGLVRARVADLEAEAAPAEPVIEGTVVGQPPPVTGLDPEDSWYAKVESVISSEDAEAAIADVRRSKSLTTARKDAIIAAIKAREQALLSRSAA